MSTTTTKTFVPLPTDSYMSTHSPKEILLIIAKTLHPKYHMDLAQVTELQKALKEIIITPQQYASEIGAIKSKVKPTRMRRSSSKYTFTTGRVNNHFRPPDSVNGSFYFHHTMPQFSELLPQVDLSKYEKPKKENMAVEKNREVSAEVTTPTKERADSPDLPSSPPVSSHPAENECEMGDAEYGEDEVKVQNEHRDEKHATLDSDIDQSGMLSGDPALSLKAEETADEVALHAVVQNTGEDDSGIVMQDATIHEGESAMGFEVYIDPLNPDNYSPEAFDAEDTIGNSQQESIFSGLGLLTQDTTPTQLTGSQPFDQNDILEPAAAQPSTADPPKPRRSVRIAKARPAPPPTSSPTTSSLGKRPRGSKVTKGEPARKRPKS